MVCWAFTHSILGPSHNEELWFWWWSSSSLFCSRLHLMDPCHCLYDRCLAHAALFVFPPSTRRSTPLSGVWPKADSQKHQWRCEDRRVKDKQARCQRRRHHSATHWFDIMTWEQYMSARRLFSVQSSSYSTSSPHSHYHLPNPLDVSALWYRPFVIGHCRSFQPDFGFHEGEKCKVVTEGLGKRRVKGREEKNIYKPKPIPLNLSKLLEK